MKTEQTKALEKWKARVKKEDPTVFNEILKRIGQPMVIFKSYDNGDKQWVVSPENEEGFWMDAFTTKKEATQFCKSLGWKTKALD